MKQVINRPIGPAPRSHARPLWQWLIGLALSAGVVALAVGSREWLLEAMGLARDAHLGWLLAALGVILVSYVVSGQVLRIGMRSFGHRLGTLRAGATALVAILISQSMPAGGVGGYAFLFGSLRRRGASAGEAALVASFEAMSYAIAMVLVALFSLVYLTLYALGTGAAVAAIVLPLLLGLGTLAGLVAAAAALTRGTVALPKRLQGLHDRLARLRGRPCDPAWGQGLAERIAGARALLAEHRYTLARLVGVQLVALCGHSLAMLLILLSLGVHASFAVVLAAFGAALVTSLLNVLPGGGGTIETILAAVLGFLAVGPAAVPAAIIFRLLNFWLLLPPAALGYAWLMRRR